MKQLSDGTIVGKHTVYVPISGQPGKMRAYPSCGWDLDENGLPPMSRVEKLMKDELEKIQHSSLPLTINETRKILGLEPISEYPFGAASIYFKSEEDFMKQHETIVKERKNIMHPTNAGGQFDPYYLFGLNFGNSVTITGFEFGSDDKVYALVNGDKCQIYPKDDTAKREVEPIRNLDIQEFLKTYHEKTGKTVSGGKINRLQKALAKWRRMLTPFSTKQFNGPVFDKIVFSGNATILIDTYGKKKKTVVKCQDGEPYDPEKALLTALFIREYGKNTYHDLMEICHEEYEKCGEPNKPKPKKKTVKKSVLETKND